MNENLTTSNDLTIPMITTDNSVEVSKSRKPRARKPVADEKQRHFYTVAQFVNLVGENTISNAIVYKMIKQKAVPFSKFGNVFLIPADFVEGFLSRKIVEVSADGTQN